MESFDGALHGQSDAFTFAHAATTTFEDRSREFFTIVPGSGTGELAATTGTGGIVVEADGTHRIWFERTEAGIGRVNRFPVAVRAARSVGGCR